MLRISHDQMNVFRSALVLDLENRLFKHACSSYPEPFHAFGPQCFRTLVQLAMQKASFYQIVSEAGHRLIFRLILECGVDFDFDPVLGWAGPILAAQSGEFQRITQLASAADEYSSKTASSLQEATLNFAKFRTAWPGRPSPEKYLKELRACCTTLFPAKAELVPDATWPLLITTATEAASEHGWRTRTAHAVLFGLYFLAGSGFLLDPRFAFVPAITIEPPTDAGEVLHQIVISNFERWYARSE